VANLTEDIHQNLSKILYSDFIQYVVQILKATNTPGITVIRIEEKYKESPSEPVQYFDRALFVDLDFLGSTFSLGALINKLGKTPLLVFGVSSELVTARNTLTGEEIQFHPNELSAHLLFLLPLIHGIRGQASNQETWMFAELITVLKNELIRQLDTPKDKQQVPSLILELIKASITRYFLQDNGVDSAFKLVDQEVSKVKGQKYLEIISRLKITGLKNDLLLVKFLTDLDTKALGLIKNVFVYDFSQIDSEILGSLIYRIVNAESGSRSHMVSEENSLKIIGPILVEPYLIELTRLDANSKEYQTLVSKVLDFSFLDPTNGTGNLLATAMNKIATFVSITGHSNDFKSDLKIENFVAINEDPIGAEVSRIIIWFTYLNLVFTPGATKMADLVAIFNKIQVFESNPLEQSWHVASGKTLPNFIFGVPTFKGWHKMTEDEKALFNHVADSFNPSNLDFSSAWLVRAARLISGTESQACFGLTNSLVQGKQVQLLWPNVFMHDVEIGFAYPSFKWLNDPKQNTGVTAVIVGLRAIGRFDTQPTIRQNGEVRKVKIIGPYLVDGMTNIIESQTKRTVGSQLPLMVKGNMPYDNGNLLLTPNEKDALLEASPEACKFIKRIVGSDEFINSIERFCLWIPNDDLPSALAIRQIAERIDDVRKFRLSGKDEAAKKLAKKPHQFREFRSTENQTLVVPSVSSENRRFIPMGFVGPDTIVSNLSFAIYECPPWVLPILSSSMHMTWVTTTCGNLETRIRYSSQLCYNTFPLPVLSQDQQKDLAKLAFELISCREKFPDKSLGDLYSTMPIALEKQHLIIDQYVDGIYGLRGSISDQDRLRILLEIYAK
jgi:hypothetical protein